MSVGSALALSLGEKYASLAVGVLSSMVLARLLAPTDIGTFSIAMVLLSFINAFRDFGVNMYVVQAKTLSVDDVRGAFSAQLLLGVGIALLIAAFSVPAAAFYNDPKLRSIFLIIALIYVVQPFGSITQAWLAREMRFGALGVINVSSALGSAGSSILLAYEGHGPVSLALGNLTGIAIATMVSLRYRPAHFPWRPSFHNVRRVLKLGSQSSGLNLVNNLISGSPELLLGKLQGFAAVGLFSRAQGLVSMFGRLITDGASRVSFSFFAGEAREGRTIGVPFIRATTCVTAVGWVFCVAVGGLADPIVRLMYGSRWIESVPLVRLLSLGLAFAIPATFVSAALTAVGGLTILLRATVVGAVVHIALLAAAAPFGLHAIGWAAVVSGLFHSAIFLEYTRRTIRFSWSGMGRGLAHSGIVAVFAATGPVAVLAFWGLEPDAVGAPLGVGCATTAMASLAAIFVSRHPLGDQLRPLLQRVSRLARV